MKNEFDEPIVKNAIQDLVNYLYEDEKKDFESYDKKDRKSHIFNKILIVKNFLKYG